MQTLISIAYEGCGIGEGRGGACLAIAPRRQRPGALRSVTSRRNRFPSHLRQSRLLKRPLLRCPLLEHLPRRSLLPLFSSQLWFHLGEITVRNTQRHGQHIATQSAAASLGSSGGLHRFLLLELLVPVRQGQLLVLCALKHHLRGLGSQQSQDAT